MKVEVAEVIGAFYPDGNVRAFKNKKFVPLPTKKSRLVGLMSEVEDKGLGISKGDYVFFEKGVEKRGLLWVKKGGKDLTGLLAGDEFKTLGGKRISRPFEVIGAFYGLLRIPEGRELDE